ncbi:MAG: universal stress protein [Rubrobacter sp.]|nr:universal stress protein [Rubrobacter sp.]
MSEQDGGQELQRGVGTAGLFAPAYGNLGSSIYYALGLVAASALGLTPVAFMAAGGLFVLTVLTYAEGATMYPEAGGSSNFARHAFNEFASFFGGWALSLDYVLTIAISAFFVPHYLGVFWAPLRENPWDIIVGIAVIAILCTLNIVGIKQSTMVNALLAFADLLTQALLVILGLVLLFNPGILVTNVILGVAPTWSDAVYGFTLALIAYSGIETISNLAEEAEDPGRNIPRASLGIVVSLLTVYLGITVISMMAMPVYQDASGTYTTELATTYAEDPVLGIVDNLPVEALIAPLRIFVGILAATILLVATNAGIIGISRMQYSMATHRQLPSILGRLSPRSLTPVVAIAGYGALAALVVIPGQSELLADIYAYGVMLSFTVAHLSILALRWRRPELERPFKVPLALRIRGREVPVLVVLGALGTFVGWVAIIVTKPEARWVGTAWMIVGIAVYVLYRRRQGLSLTEEVELEAAPVEDVPRIEYADILVPVTGSRISEEMIATAARLVPQSKKGEKPVIHALDVVEIPQNLPSRNVSLERIAPEKYKQAQEALEEARHIGEEYGVEVHGYTIGARNAGRAIVEEARRLKPEVVMFGVPRKRGLRDRVFGNNVDYVLKNCPCKIHIVLEEPKS